MHCAHVADIQGEHREGYTMSSGVPDDWTAGQVRAFSHSLDPEQPVVTVRFGEVILAPGSAAPGISFCRSLIQVAKVVMSWIACPRKPS